MDGHDSKPEESDRETRRRVLTGLAFLGIGAVAGGLTRWFDGSTGPAPMEVSAPSGVRTDRSESSTSSVATTEPTSRSTSRSAQSIEAAPETTLPPRAVTKIEPVEATPEVIATVVCRAAWRAEAARAGLVSHDPVRLTLHHTAVPQTELSQGPARVRQHQTHHLSLGWPDLAYHFVVDRTGTAYQGRDWRYRGDTGTEYDPTGHFLVSMEGDFNSQEPTPDQLDTTIALFAWAAQEFSIDPATLAGHSTYAATSCPGDSAIAMIGLLAESIASTGLVGVDLACGERGPEIVAMIESGSRRGPHPRGPTGPVADRH